MAIESLAWLRTDLRTTDNRALLAAAGSGGVAALWVLSPGDWTRHDDAACKVQLILRTVAALSQRLDALNIPLLIRRARSPGEVPGIVARVARELGVSRVAWNDEYPVDERRRDDQTASLLRGMGVAVSAFADRTVLAPGTVLTGEGRAFTVFTPFRRAWLKRLAETDWAPQGSPRRQPPTGLRPDGVPSAVDGFDSGVAADLWPGGEQPARRRLESFVKRRIGAYHTGRDQPALDGTSTLSPYLTIGAISARQCLAAAVAANRGKADGQGGAATWITELIWREFYTHVLAAFPRVSMGRAFKPATDRLRWSTNEQHLEAWRAGRTGYPIVDAGMRQLAATGWMHNRLRMITAMFLTKDLFVDWRLGERHFMRSLVDGDLASNNGGWQWSASTGTDSVPYFRIFNPESQSRRFDPEGTFIRRWCPELTDLDAKAIHAPGSLPPGLRVRLDYPEPIVDHAAARDRTLKAFKALGQ